LARSFCSPDVQEGSLRPVGSNDGTPTRSRIRRNCTINLVVSHRPLIKEREKRKYLPLKRTIVKMALAFDGVQFT